MDRYEELRALVAVVDREGFSAAAQQMNLATSVISRRVQDLESRLGVKLLNRTTRRVNPTEAGTALAERARQLLSDLEEAEQSVSSATQALAGRLRVATPLTFGLRHMSAVVSEFCRDHPQVQMELDLNDRQVNLLEEGFDMAVRIGELADSSLIARRLNEVTMAVVASPAYLSRVGCPGEPMDLEQHEGLYYALSSRSPWRFTDDNGRLIQPKVPKCYVSNNGDNLANMAVAGLGVAILPRFIVHEYIQRGELVTLLENYQTPTSGLYLVYPPGRYQSRRVRAFADFLANRFCGEVPWESAS